MVNESHLSPISTNGYRGKKGGQRERQDCKVPVVFHYGMKRKSVQFKAGDKMSEEVFRPSTLPAAVLFSRSTYIPK